MGQIPGSRKALRSLLSFPVLSLPAGLAWLEEGRWEPLFLALTAAGVGLLILGVLLLRDPALPRPGRSVKGWSGMGLACLLGAAAAGLILVLKGRLLVLVLGPAGAAVGLVYALTPKRRLMAPALAAAFLGFGPLLTFGGYYVLTGHSSLQALFLGLPSGLLMSAALWSGFFPGGPAGTGDAPLLRTGARRVPVEGRRSRSPGQAAQGTLFDLEEKPEEAARGQAEPRSRTRATDVLIHLLFSLTAFICLVPLGLRSSLGLLILTGLAPLPLALSGTLALVRGGREDRRNPAGWRTIQAGVCLNLLLGLSLAMEGWLRA